MARIQQNPNMAMLAVLLALPITTSAHQDVTYKPLDYRKRQEPPSSSQPDQKAHVDEMPAWSTSSSLDGLDHDLQHGRFSFLHGTRVQTSRAADADESEDPILGSAPTQTDLLEASAPTETLPLEHDLPDCTHLLPGSWKLPSFHRWNVSTTSLTWGFMATAIVVFAAAHLVQRMRKQRRRKLARQGSLPFTEKGVLAVGPR